MMIKNTLNRKVGPIFLGLALGLGFFASPLLAAESNLNTIFSLAKINDPKYAVAGADKTLNKFQSTLAYSAYAPTLSATFQDYLATTGTIQNQNNMSVTQPLIDLEKYEQFKQGAPKEAYAEAVFMTQEQDLAARCFSATAALITQNQAVKSNNIRINTLQKQLDRIRRMIQLGYGTITDERDIKVRFEQAQANGVTLELNRRNAITQIMTLTKKTIDARDFELPESHSLKGQFEINGLLAKVLESNPNLTAARKSEEISMLEANRARKNIFPTLSVVQGKRWGDQFNDQTTILTLSMPLDATRVIGGLSAGAQEEKAFETRRQVEEQTIMLTNQLYESVVLGREALDNKKVAVEAAKLSVEANERSLIAGVRTTIEVLNSIDTLYQTRNDYATTALNLGNAYLNLLLISGETPTDAIAQTQHFLFGT
jgi:protease secretion system outer membrane protein